MRPTLPIDADVNVQPELHAAIITEPLVVPPTISVQAALAHMSGIQANCPNSPESDLYLDSRASCALVVEDGALLGLITEHDIVRLSAEQHDLCALTVADVMTRSPLTLRDRDFSDIFVALNLLQRHRIRHLPLLDDQNHLVGLITQDSLRRSFAAPA